MPRTSRVAPGGMVFHVLNRGVGRMRLFDDDDDYAAFERALHETLRGQPMRVCAYCIMPNHFVLWPEANGDLARLMQRLTNTHVQRWQRHKHLVGTGHVYQGRYKSFPVETDEYFYQVVRYVERNVLRANMVERAEDWRWSSIGCRVQGIAKEQAILGDWPLARPRQWRRLVNQPQTDAELKALRHCVHRNQPYGSHHWVKQVAITLGLESTLRTRGRPKKVSWSCPPTNKCAVPFLVAIGRRRQAQGPRRRWRSRSARGRRKRPRSIRIGCLVLGPRPRHH